MTAKNTALEGCDSCAQAGHNSNVPSGQNPVSQDGSTTGVSNNKTDGFTYDEGKGVKDTVLLTGPLSEVYTQALNVYFAKKPIDTSDVKEEQLREVKAAEETLATDEYLLQKAAKNQAQFDVVDANSSGTVDYVSADSDPSKVDNTGFIVSDADVLMPEVIEHVNKLAKSSPKPLYVVIVAAPSGDTMGVRLQKRFVEIDPHDSTHILFSDKEERLALEGLFESNVKFVNGFPNFVHQLENK